MLKKHKKPDRALYVFPARRMIEENESQQKSSLINDALEYSSNSSVNVTRTNTVNTAITHQHKHLESSPSRQQRTVSIATKDQVNGLHKILSNKSNNETSLYRQQRNIPRASRVPSNKFNNKTPHNKQQLIVTYTSKDQINNGIHKPLSNTLNNKSFPDEDEFGVTKEDGHDFVCPRQFSHARQPYSSNLQETNKFKAAGRGRLLYLMENYLKMESEQKNVHSKESDSLTSTDTCGSVIHNQHTIHNNSHPNYSSNGVLRNKRENPKILGKGRARLAKKSTMAERESPRVSLDRSSLTSPDMSVGQFDSCDQEEEAQQQEEKRSPRVSLDRSSLKSPDISSDGSEIPDENITEKTAVEHKPLNWAEEMRKFDRLHRKGNDSDDDDDDDGGDSNCSISPHVLRNSVEKENWLYNSASPESHVLYKTNNYSPNGSQYSDNGENNRHRSKHRINTRWRTSPSNSNSNGSSFNCRNKVTSNFVVNGNQISPKDLRHKINSITDNGRINTSSYGNKQISLTNGDHTERITKSWEESFRSRCSAAGCKFFDTHCHLDRIFDDMKCKSEKQFSSFKEFKEANWTTFPKEFAGCLTVFCDPWKFDSKGSLLSNFITEDNVWIAMGCHPKKVKHFTAERMQQLKDCLLQVPSIVAVGEIGLDYSGVFYQQIDDQKQALRDQIRLAVDVNKPIIIHCRDAEEDCLQIFQEVCPPEWRIHLHCYTNSYNHAQKWLNAFPNLYIGLTPKVTYKSSTALHDTAHRISLDRLLLETDAPYFIPSMVPLKNTMVTSHPGMAFSVAETVADLKNISVKKVLKACLENTETLYGIKL